MGFWRLAKAHEAISDRPTPPAISASKVRMPESLLGMVIRFIGAGERGVG